MNTNLPTDISEFKFIVHAQDNKLYVDDLTLANKTFLSTNGSLFRTEYSPDKSIVIGLHDYYGIYHINLWSVPTGNLLKNIILKWCFGIICISTDNTRLIVQTGDKKVTIWDLTNDKSQPKEHNTSKNFNICKSNGLYLACASFKKIYIYHTDTFELLAVSKTSFRIYKDFFFSPNKQYFAYVSKEDVIEILSLNTFEVVSIIKHDTERIFSLISFSADSKKIIAGCEENDIRIWDVTNGNLLQQFKKLCIGISWPIDKYIILEHFREIYIMCCSTFEIITVVQKPDNSKNTEMSIGK